MSPGGSVGDFTWHELATTDPGAAMDFYAELFGWTKGAAHDMGDMGVYQLVSHGGQDVGGVYKVRDNSTPPSWLSYVRVADAAKAAGAAKTAGGRILNGPMEVPGGSWIVMMLDPQGGAFAVVEPPKAAMGSDDASPAKRVAKKAAKKAPAKSPPAKVAAPKAAPAKVAASGKSGPKKAAKKAVKTAAKKGAKAAKKVAKVAKKAVKKAVKKTASKPAAKRAVAKKSAKPKAKAKGKAKSKK
jgi:predicted enzyme related to lactoylglutathione lyase